MSSRPARDAWVEMRGGAMVARHALKSRPARDAWVEIPEDLQDAITNEVAPRKGRVG